MWIYNARIITPNGIINGKIEFSEETGKIIRVLANKTLCHIIQEEGFDAQGHLLAPGMVDIHVHLRDLQQESKETFETGSQAALNGGVTTVFDMPNKNPVVDNIEVYKKIREKVNKIKTIDIFSFIFLNSHSKEHMKELSQISPWWKVIFGGTTNVNGQEYTILKDLTNSTNDKIFLSIHAEDACIIEKNAKKYSKTYENHGLIRSEAAELTAVINVLEQIDKSKTQNVHYHFAHTTSIDIIDYIDKQKLPFVSWEVTPHHLTLSTTVLKRLKEKGFVNPPLRQDKTAKKLLKYYLENKIPVLATDHAPHTLQDKIDKKESGFPGLDTAIPVMLSNGASPELLIKTYAENPALLTGLNDRGILSAGRLADMILIDPTLQLKVTPDIIKSKSKWSPWEDEVLTGWPIKVWKKGKLVYDRFE